MYIYNRYERQKPVTRRNLERKIYGLSGLSQLFPNSRRMFIRHYADETNVRCKNSEIDKKKSTNKEIRPIE